MNKHRFISVLAVLIAVLLSGGCVDITQSLWFNADKTIKLKVSLAIDESLMKSILSLTGTGIPGIPGKDEMRRLNDRFTQIVSADPDLLEYSATDHTDGIIRRLEYELVFRNVRTLNTHWKQLLDQAGPAIMQQIPLGFDFTLSELPNGDIGYLQIVGAAAGMKNNVAKSRFELVSVKIDGRMRKAVLKDAGGRIFSVEAGKEIMGERILRVKYDEVDILVPSGKIVTLQPGIRKKDTPGKRFSKDAMIRMMIGGILADKNATITVHGKKIISSNGQTGKDEKTTKWIVPLARLVTDLEYSRKLKAVINH